MERDKQLFERLITGTLDSITTCGDFVGGVSMRKLQLFTTGYRYANVGISPSKLNIRGGSKSFLFNNSSLSFGITIPVDGSDKINFYLHLIAHELAHAMTPTFDHGVSFLFFFFAILECQRRYGYYSGPRSTVTFRYGRETVEMATIFNWVDVAGEIVKRTKYSDIINDIKRKSRRGDMWSRVIG